MPELPSQCAEPSQSFSSVVPVDVDSDIEVAALEGFFKGPWDCPPTMSAIHTTLEYPLPWFVAFAEAPGPSHPPADVNIDLPARVEGDQADANDIGEYEELEDRDGAIGTRPHVLSYASPIASSSSTSPGNYPSPPHARGEMECPTQEFEHQRFEGYLSSSTQPPPDTPASPNLRLEHSTGPEASSGHPADFFELHSPHVEAGQPTTGPEFTSPPSFVVSGKLEEGVCEWGGN